MDADDDRKAKRPRARGGTRVSVDELVAKSHSLFDRVSALIDKVRGRRVARTRRRQS